MRDMALGGPMFSEFLLMTMYTSATSKIDSLEPEERINQERLFSQLAKEYLTKEMEGPTKITTIQGLLLLSGRECATGNVSQGWNHAGLVSLMSTRLTWIRIWGLLRSQSRGIRMRRGKVWGAYHRAVQVSSCWTITDSIGVSNLKPACRTRQSSEGNRIRYLAYLGGVPTVTLHQGEGLVIRCSIVKSIFRSVEALSCLDIYLARVRKTHYI